jgi:peptide/nickel transport system ATP-binding protein
MVLGLVGESGSGKTTVVPALLSHARRRLRISSGEVEVDGVDLLRLPPAELRAVRGARVAYVPQDPSAALNPTLRVGTQLREALHVHPGVVDDPGGRILEAPISCPGIRTSCPAVSASGSRSPARWSSSPTCSCATR